MQFGSIFASGRGWLPLKRQRPFGREGEWFGRDVAQSLAIQGRVLLALMLREARTRYGRQRMGYLWALIEPIMHIVGFYFIFRYTLRAIPLGESLPMFLATGLSTYFGFSNVLNRTQGGFGSNESLLAYPLVNVMDVFLGRALLEFATWVVVTFVILGALIISGIDPLPAHPLMMVAAMILLFGIGFGAGTMIGILAQFFPSLDSLLTLPLRLLYFASGVFFLPDVMPPAIRNVIEWNPVLQGITLFRMGYYANYDSHMLRIEYLIMWSAVCVLLAFLAERVARKRLLSHTW